MSSLFAGKSLGNNVNAKAFAVASEKLKVQMELQGKSVSICVMAAEQKAELTQQPIQPAAAVKL